MKRYTRTILKLLLLMIAVVANPAASNTNGWIVEGEMPFPVYNGQALIIDSKIVILGGNSATTGLPTDTIQVYNPVDESWTITGHLEFPRSGFVADTYHNDIIAFGGTAGDTAKIENFEKIQYSDYTSSRISFDDTTNRVNSAGAVYGDILYILGGYPGKVETDNPIPYVVKYNLASKSTSPLSFAYSNIDAQTPYHQMVAIINQDMFIFGGVFFVPTKRVYKFNLLEESYERIYPDMADARAGGAAVTGLDQSIYLIGGFNETLTAMDTVEVYSLTQFGYASEKSSVLNYARKECMAVNFDNTIYVFGGLNSEDKAVPFIEKLNLDGNTTQIDDESKSVSSMVLNNNFPNPFNSNTLISFELAKPQNTRLLVYNTRGMLVKTLISSNLGTGYHQITWDGTDDNNAPVSSDVYFYQLITEYGTEIKKMVLIK